MYVAILSFILLIPFFLGNSQASQDATNSFQYNLSTLPDLIKRIEGSIISINVFDQNNNNIAIGSGFIYDNNGHIITNNHLVKGGERFIITFSDLFSVESLLVGRDPYTDIAVLQIDTSTLSGDRIKPLPFGNSSNLMVGEQILAIGNPQGLSNTVTYGIVSRLNGSSAIDPLTNQSHQFSIPNMIQIDADINTGNSGGPLLDFNGDVIGINTAASSKFVSINQEDGDLPIPLPGLNFAIPSNLVKKVVDNIVEKGSYKHPYLGISAITIDPVVRLNYTLDETLRGVLIVELDKGGPAEIRGLKPFDIITTIDDIKIKSMDDFISILDGKSVGESAKIGIKRENLNTVLAIELAERPNL